MKCLSEVPILCYPYLSTSSLNILYSRDYWKPEGVALHLAAMYLEHFDQTCFILIFDDHSYFFYFKCPKWWDSN